jgi:hypothetical protein
MHEQPDYHHPPYAWLVAAVLFWGMVAFLLAPTVWTWVRASPRPMTAAAPKSDDGWILWKHIPAQGEWSWSWVHGFTQERACEKAKARSWVEERVNGFTVETMRLVCLPWHIDPHGWTVLPTATTPLPVANGGTGTVSGPLMGTGTATTPLPVANGGTGTVSGPLMGTGTATTYTLERQP